MIHLGIILGVGIAILITVIILKKKHSNIYRNANNEINQYLQEGKRRVEKEIQQYRNQQMNKADEDARTYRARIDEGNNDYKRKADEAVSAYQTSIEVRQSALDKEIELRRNRITELDEAVKRDEARMKTEIERHKKDFRTQLDALKSSYDARNLQVKEAITTIEAKLEEWSKAERIAYEERVKRDETMNHNRLIISKRATEELQELYNAISKLKIANPLPLYKAVYEMYLRGPVKELGVRLNVAGVCGIYKITNTINSKVYVGQSVDLAERWKQHIKRGTKSEIGTLSGAGLYDAMFEDGVWNFSFELLEECGKDALNERERFWIQYFNSAEIGYNKKI